MKTRFLLLFLFIGTQLFSQKLALKKADFYFEHFVYNQAIEQYLKVLKKDSSSIYSLRRLSSAYFLTGKPELSETCLKRLIISKSANKEDSIMYVKTLLKQGKYKDVFLFQKNTPYLSDSTKFLSEASFNLFRKDSATYKISLLPCNTANSDFSPTLYKNKYLFYVSSREKDNVSRRKYTWNQQPFLDVYYSVLNEPNMIKKANPFSNEINTMYHEGGMCFNKSGKLMWFTRDNYINYSQNKALNGTLNLGIYKATLKGLKIQIIEPLSINSTEYSIGHPALSPDSSRLYFVSNMQGGYGGTDIYYCQLKNYNIVSEPINLGSEINSAGNEMFPSFDSNGNLYFASDGRVGLGGLDMYIAKKENDSFLKPTNFGYPVNTCSDDFGIVFFGDDSKGYFASNRKGGKGDDDIYFLEIKKKQIKTDSVIAQNNSQITNRTNNFYNSNKNRNDSLSINKNKDSIAIVLKNDENKKIKNDSLNNQKDITANLNDKSKTNLNSQDKNKAIADKKREESKKEEERKAEVKKIKARNDSLALVAKVEVKKKEELKKIEELRKKEELEKITELKKKEEIEKNKTKIPTYWTINGKVFDKETGKVLPKSDIDFELPNTQPKRSITDSLGHFEFRIDSVTMVSLKASAKKYFGLPVFIDSLDFKKGKVINKNLYLEKISLNKSFILSNVFYDYDKADIKAKAAKDLDELVRFLKENPAMVIEISSHTDSRGNSHYNKMLSQARALETAIYLIGRGIDTKRLITVGYGEEHLLNNCGDDSNCSDEMHQRNRRTEFKILSY